MAITVMEHLERLDIPGGGRIFVAFFRSKRSR
jgi:hypothetical protein